MRRPIERLGEAVESAGMLEPASGHSVTLASGAPRPGHPGESAAGWAALALAYQSRLRFDLHSAGEAAREALKLARETADQVLEARALSLIGFTSVHAESPSRAMSDLEAAASAGERANDAHSLADTLTSLGKVHMQSGDPQAAKTCYAGALEIAAESRNQALRALAMSGLGWTAWAGGDPTQARALFVESKVVAAEIGDRALHSESLSFLSDIARMNKDFGGARRLLNQALEIAMSVENPFLQARALSALGRLALDRGDTAEAEKVYERAVAAAAAAGAWFVHIRALQGLSQVRAAQGNPAVAEELLNEAVELAREKHDQEGMANCLFALGRLVRERGDEDQAMALHQRALSLRNEMTSGEGVADSLHAVAGLLAERRPATAARLMGAAESIRAAQAREGASSSATCPCCRQDAEVVAKAVKARQLQRALEEGASLSGSDAAAYASRGRGARDRPALGWESLTPTEREVATLAMQGLTNPRIGERMFISRRTVGTHLGHIYAKLGVNSKIELVKFAAKDE